MSRAAKKLAPRAVVPRVVDRRELDEQERWAENLLREAQAEEAQFASSMRIARPEGLLRIVLDTNVYFSAFSTRR